MKLFNKIISAVCALGLLATTAVSVVSVQAEEGKVYERPEVSANLTSYDKTTGKGEITVSVNGVSSILTGTYAGYAVVSNTIEVGLDDADFVIEGYYDTVDTVFETITQVDGYDYGGTFNPGKYNTTNKSCKIMLSGTKSTTDMPNIFKIPFEVNTASTNKDKSISIKSARIDIQKGRTKVAFKSEDGKVDIADAAIKIMIPADGSALNVDPTDIGLDADAWTDGTSTAAVGLANVAAPASGAASQVVWTIKATPTSTGVEAEKTLEPFDIPTIDSAATIGLIVNYDTTEFSSVTVVSGELK